ncbi:phage virion morphogenesis protein [Escherichia coli]|uniref:phage virion morphogenesis protein n=1 Tax=Escherichia coli TaxID=562 RepID=UPI0002A24BDD|nr:phage virion morphogenesis protein [Escherichia coli]MRT10787.1 hypothetical protein [Enterobacteriaceae bacterium RIT711]EFD0291020.1 hypothetical protein [Escherichia coli]EFN7993741.1 hypothetical protein [Escherichia coli]EGM0668458.1 hypothetical protein [Escherichia coli]EIT7544050.1 phage virion morphogenesis protein [Escherichia coli]
MAGAIRGELNPSQLKVLKDALKSLELTPAKRRRLLWRLAKYGLVAAAKRNVRNQQTPDGVAWQKRKTKRKGKMLRNMPKLIRVREMPEIDAVRLYLSGGSYRNGQREVPAGTVGYAQQNGMTATISARQSASSSGQTGPATLRQAKRLRKAGFKVRSGKRWKTPGFKEIQEKVSAAQAGLLIRKLEGTPAKKTWTVTLPAREFLGIGEDDFMKALARQLQAIGFGWDVNAQDM